jgi:hypothetical protein
VKNLLVVYKNGGNPEKDFRAFVLEKQGSSYNGENMRLSE